MYKAIKEIGGYNIGDEVPTDKALAWKEMYAVPHVEEVSSKPAAKAVKVKEAKNEIVVEESKPIKSRFSK
ncbi:MAG: hypothetical protein DRO67_07450 [Candidatus Asgardarchaeum californiense]|nr:MAG: hypothetical protein DRO67_07450 [Candidatus Asgardarchaeum californiense]